MDNVPAEVALAQSAVLDAFAPTGFEVRQVLTERSHGAALDEIMAGADADLVLILDIDCVPLTTAAIPTLAASAEAGALAGCVQRANHIDNGATSTSARSAWRSAGRCGSGSAAHLRADRARRRRRGANLPCEETGAPVEMLWPSRVDAPCWDLTDGRQFGVNTEYEGAFLHTFNIRSPDNQRRFIERCRAILDR